MRGGIRDLRILGDLLDLGSLSLRRRFALACGVDGPEAPTLRLVRRRAGDVTVVVGTLELGDGAPTSVDEPFGDIALNPPPALGGQPPEAQGRPVIFNPKVDRRSGPLVPSEETEDEQAESRPGKEGEEAGPEAAASGGEGKSGGHRPTCQRSHEPPYGERTVVVAGFLGFGEG